MLRVIIGPPAAGKSTYCDEHARPGDVVIDYDRVAQALAPPTDVIDEHKHAPAVAQVARAARAAAIDKARELGDEVDVWLIHATPSARLLAEYRAMGAEIVTIDPGEAVVMERCKRLRPWQMQQAVKRWYSNTQPAEAPPAPARKMVDITTFGFDRTPAPRARITIDTRPLPNPHEAPGLRARTGLDPAVRQWVLAKPETQNLINESLLRIGAPSSTAAVTVAVGCSAGRHRSVVVAEALADELEAAGHTVIVRHTEVSEPKPRKAGRAAKQTTTAKGLGWRHQQQRTYLTDIHIDGTLCWWCDRPMHVDKTKNWDGKALAADHSLSRHHGGQLADRLLHGTCNSERQEGDRDHLRPALHAPQDDADPVGQPAPRLRWPESPAGD